MPRPVKQRRATPAPSDKRAALLEAALRLLARSGLHDTPTAAVAREAGVAAGTLYLYFPSKDALINALYLELLGDQHRAAEAVGDADDDPREALWQAWRSLARWHLDQPEASNVMHQCRASGILTTATRNAEQRMRASGLKRFRDAIAAGLLRDLPLEVFWSLYAGPIFALVEARTGQRRRVTDALLRETFDGVARAVLPNGA